MSSSMKASGSEPANPSKQINGQLHRPVPSLHHFMKTRIRVRHSQALAEARIAAQYMCTCIRGSYSESNFSISASTSLVGTLTAPDLLTRNLLSKFQPGSPAPVESRMNFQSSGAVSPTTLPSFMTTPLGGKFFLAANATISSSLPNSCPPNSWDGKARMARSSPNLPSCSNLAYSREVRPHRLATLVAYTTLPLRSAALRVEPSLFSAERS